ncbi:MAG: cytochrome c oxidase subunit II, partial [Thermoanaerobaculia bacterium]
RSMLLFIAATIAAPCLAGDVPAAATPKRPFWEAWKPVVDVSRDGYRAVDLFWYTTWMCIIAFTLVVLALVAFSILYREKPGHRAFYTHGTDRKSFAITGALAALVFFTIDMRLVQISQKDIKEYLFNWPTSADTVRVEVYGQQWAWNIRYAGPDGVFNTADDVVTLNDMRVPVGRPVMVNLKSKDVIHSFYLPNFRLKHDSNPGYVTRTWFQAKEAGNFEIACSQMCGWAHYKMRGELKVLPAADFDTWMKESQGDALRRFDPADKEQMWGWEWVQ